MRLMISLCGGIGTARAGTNPDSKPTFGSLRTITLCSSKFKQTTALTACHRSLAIRATGIYAARYLEVGLRHFVIAQPERMLNITLCSKVPETITQSVGVMLICSDTQGECPKCTWRQDMYISCFYPFRFC